jgi:hypothetical protein
MMMPREYIATAMKLADECIATRSALERHLREHLDEIIEDAYTLGYTKAIEKRINPGKLDYFLNRADVTSNCLD